MTASIKGRPSLAVPVEIAVHEPDLSPRHKRAIERALRWAWVEVKSRWPEDVGIGPEERITEHLQRVLNDVGPDHRRRAPGLATFETIDRGGKVTTNDGRIEKAPDLVFRPPLPRGVQNRGDFGWFVECKVVGGGRVVALYLTEGVNRFVRAEYARRMPSGAMVAYVRDGAVPATSLAPHLPGAVRPGKSSDVVSSVHPRRSLAPPCVDIVLTHLWFDARAA